MNGLLSWLTDSAVSLIILYLAYSLFLRKEAFFQSNRFYLLSALLFSMALPFIRLPAPPVTLNYSFFIPEVTIGTGNPETAVTSASGATAIEIILWVYLVIASLFLLHLLYKFFQLHRFINRYGMKKYRDVNIIDTGLDIAPFSFLNFIIINGDLYNENEKREIIEHERAHIRQMHTLDLLIVEIITALQWFNPFVWLYRSSLKEIHEYLADREVIRRGTDLPFYRTLLLNLHIGREYLSITNNFSKSLTKKRIMMMAKIRPPAWAKLKFLLIVPAVALLAIMCNKSAEEEKPALAEETQVITFSDGSTREIPVRASTRLPDGTLRFEEDRQGEMEREIFFIVEEMPMFGDGPGPDLFRRFIADNLRYPQIAAENGIEGRVFVQFVVDADGSVSDATIVRGIDPSLDREALRVVMSSPAWTPGRQRGQPVNVAFTFPINFVLQE